jgi:hypothetical protein
LFEGYYVIIVYEKDNYMMNLYETPKEVEICTMQGIVNYHAIGTVKLNGREQEVYKRFKRYYTYSKMQMRMFPVAKAKLGL